MIRRMTVVDVLRGVLSIGRNRSLWARVDETTEGTRGMETMEQEPATTTLLRTLGWISAGAGALGLGLVVGRELRHRYKFNRRTPYDVYAHSGDHKSDLEFGVGV